MGCAPTQGVPLGQECWQAPGQMGSPPQPPLRCQTAPLSLLTPFTPRQVADRGER